MLPLRSTFLLVFDFFFFFFEFYYIPRLTIALPLRREDRNAGTYLHPLSARGRRIWTDIVIGTMFAKSHE